MCLAVMPDDPGVLDTMDDWNTRTHGESGLIRRIREEGVSIAEAEEAVMAMLKEHMTKGAIIAGNSVHHDMRFIREGDADGPQTTAHSGSSTSVPSRSFSGESPRDGPRSSCRKDRLR